MKTETITEIVIFNDFADRNWTEFLKVKTTTALEINMA